MEEIRQHLDKLLQSDSLASAPKLSALLRRLVLPLLDQSGLTPKEYTLGVEVFSRAPDWDPQGDSVVRVSVNRLRQRLRQIYEEHPCFDGIRFEIPKGHYRVVVRKVHRAESLDRAPSPVEAKTFRRSIVGWILAGAAGTGLGAWLRSRLPVDRPRSR